MWHATLVAPFTHRNKSHVEWIGLKMYIGYAVHAPFITCSTQYSNGTAPSCSEYVSSRPCLVVVLSSRNAEQLMVSPLPYMIRKFLANEPMNSAFHINGGIDLQDTSFPPSNALTEIDEPCATDVFTYFPAEFANSLKKASFYLVGKQLTELWDG